MNVTVAYYIFNTHDGGVSLGAFPTDPTSEVAGFVFTLSFMLIAKQEAVNTNFVMS